MRCINSRRRSRSELNIASTRQHHALINNKQCRNLTSQVERPSQQLFSHFGTEPPFPGCNKYCRECLAQGHNTVTPVGIEPRTSLFALPLRHRAPCDFFKDQCLEYIKPYYRNRPNTCKMSDLMIPLASLT